MENINLTQEEQNKTLDIIKRLVDRIDESYQTDKKTFPWSGFRDELNDTLNELNITTDINIGQTNLSFWDPCSIAFCRKDLAKEDYPIKVGQGFYIWLGYFPQTKGFEMHFGSGKDWNEELYNTKALKKLEEIGVFDKKGSCYYFYNNFEDLKKSFFENFLKLVSLFNSCPADDFVYFSDLKKIFNDFRKTLYSKEELDSFNDSKHHFDKMEELFQNPNFAEKYSNCKQYYPNDKSGGYFYIYSNSRSISYTMKKETEKKRNPESLSFELFEEYVKTQQVSHYSSQAIPTFNFILEWAKNKHNEKNINTTPPLNQILYGSPATGKTYNTIDRALEILGIDCEGKTREERKRLFEDYRQKGQIEFITLHQSYGYEEFVEGIKPIPTEDGENVKYEIKDGIFKTICSNAGYIQEKLDDILFDTKSRVWKISLGGKNWKDKTQELQDYCFKNNEIRIGWENASVNDETFKELGNQQKSSVLQFKYEMQIGDLVCVLDSVETIKAIGIIESDFYFDKDSQFSKKLSDFYSARKVKWIDQSIRNILSLNNGTELTLKTVYPLTKISPIDLLSLLQDKKSKTTIDNTQKPHILIIDEINRGNISKIFGELITLIEPSKRLGASEELKVKLPYSQDEFGVPSNLYIIGTMNTADRSITSLDTALRRRFEFVEMMPKPDELKDLKVQGTDINLKDMLEKINKRIEFLYDREKTIGHAFFLSECKEEENFITLEQLKGIFQNKIIPLLQEYFYNDYALIQAVLNSNRMIEKEEEKTGKLFAIDSLVNELDLENKPIYKIADLKSDIWNDKETYIALYKNDVARKLNNPNKQNTTDTEVKD